MKNELQYLVLTISRECQLVLVVFHADEISSSGF